MYGHRFSHLFSSLLFGIDHSEHSRLQSLVITMIRYIANTPTGGCIYIGITINYVYLISYFFAFVYTARPYLSQHLMPLSCFLSQYSYFNRFTLILRYIHLSLLVNPDKYRRKYR